MSRDQEMSRARGAKERTSSNNNNNNNINDNDSSNSNNAPSQHLIGAIDQGTSSTRFLVFKSGSGQLVASSQLEITRIIPKEGWVEIDPDAIMETVNATIASVSLQLKQSRSSGALSKGSSKLKCVGICNQRESTVVWDKQTGRALYNVIVWLDNRTKDIVDQLIDSVPGRDFNWLKDKTGLPMSTYFSAFKLKWLIDEVPSVKQALKENRLLFGTVDSWILWNLTGNHLTDVTNASRTFLMDIETLDWDKSLCQLFGIPMRILPKILASADDFGLVQRGPLEGLPITGVIGDQSAALFGHNRLQLGQTKATLGTGCFIMQNIGPGPLHGALRGVQRAAQRGLITTVGYKLRNRPAQYALEGSIKIAGAAITWMRDNMQLIQSYRDCDQLVNMTSHSAGVFFVPALGGLYSPYWDPNASGLFIGLSQFTRREHLIRATFDSIAFQTNDILSLMRGVTNGLMIDGGLCESDNMCQILADITGCDIVRPSMCETSALGAAMVAGCGANIWPYEEMLANSDTPYEYSSSANQNHHYPPECLHYEEKFSSNVISQSQKFLKNAVIEAAARQQQSMLGRPRVESRCSSSSSISGGCQKMLHPTAANATKSLLPNRTSACNMDAGGGGGGVNDDAGGGDHRAPVNYASDEEEEEEDDIDDINPASSVVSELESGSSQMAALSSTESGETSENLENTEYETGGEGGATTRMPDYCFAITAEAGCSGYDSSASFEVSSSESPIAPPPPLAPPAPAPPSSGPSSSLLSSLVTIQSQTGAAQTEAMNNNNSSATCCQGANCANIAAANSRGLSSAASALQPPTKPVDIFQSYISVEHRSELVSTWKCAVERSMNWTKIQHEEIRRIDYQRLSSLPISMFLFFSIGMVALSGMITIANGGRGFMTN